MQAELTLQTLLQETVNEGLYQIILSNPRAKDKVCKIKIRPVMVKGGLLFQKTAYEGTQVFHENLKQSEIIRQTQELLAHDFRQGEIEHRQCKAIVMVSKKGKTTIKRRQTENAGAGSETEQTVQFSHNRIKRHILEEGIPVPFLIDLGVQTTEGRIVRSRYDKFKQINRFLEFIEDILPTLSKERTVRIIDFGCGKSYLIFAIYYYLHELKGYDVDITGLDLKAAVIEDCNRLCEKYGYEKLRFVLGDIAAYDSESAVDMVVTLHAYDTATDHALAKAVQWGAKVILSVPCCQHEVNRQIHSDELEPLLRYGIIKERMAALITDAMRANLLDASGYETSILEFIDMEHTPKNLLIRAVKRQEGDERRQRETRRKADAVAEFLHIDPALKRLL